MAHQLYFSKRGHPLITTETSDKPILTVENYCKWYSIQVLMPDGEVKELCHDIITEVEHLLPTGCGAVDHNYHPQLLEILSIYLDMHYSNEAVEMITGRYVIEVNEKYGILDEDTLDMITPAQNPDPFLPDDKLANRVLAACVEFSDELKKDLVR